MRIQNPPGQDQNPQLVSQQQEQQIALLQQQQIALQQRDVGNQDIQMYNQALLESFQQRGSLEQYILQGSLPPVIQRKNVVLDVDHEQPKLDRTHTSIAAIYQELKQNKVYIPDNASLAIYQAYLNRRILALNSDHILPMSTFQSQLPSFLRQFDDTKILASQSPFYCFLPQYAVQNNGKQYRKFTLNVINTLAGNQLDQMLYDISNLEQNIRKNYTTSKDFENRKAEQLLDDYINEYMSTNSTFNVAQSKKASRLRNEQIRKTVTHLFEVDRQKLSKLRVISGPCTIQEYTCKLAQDCLSIKVVSHLTWYTEPHKAVDCILPQLKQADSDTQQLFGAQLQHKCQLYQVLYQIKLQQPKWLEKVEQRPLAQRLRLSIAEQVSKRVSESFLEPESHRMISIQQEDMEEVKEMLQAQQSNSTILQSDRMSLACMSAFDEASLSALPLAQPHYRSFTVSDSESNRSAFQSSFASPNMAANQNPQIIQPLDQIIMQNQQQPIDLNQSNSQQIQLSQQIQQQQYSQSQAQNQQQHFSQNQNSQNLLQDQLLQPMDFEQERQQLELTSFIEDNQSKLDQSKKTLKNLNALANKNLGAMELQNVENDVFKFNASVEGCSQISNYYENLHKECNKMESGWKQEIDETKSKIAQLGDAEDKLLAIKLTTLNNLIAELIPLQSQIEDKQKDFHSKKVDNAQLTTARFPGFKLYRPQKLQGDNYECNLCCENVRTNTYYRTNQCSKVAHNICFQNYLLQENNSCAACGAEHEEMPTNSFIRRKTDSDPNANHQPDDSDDVDDAGMDDVIENNQVDQQQIMQDQQQNQQLGQQVVPGNDVIMVD